MMCEYLQSVKISRKINITTGTSSYIVVDSVALIKLKVQYHSADSLKKCKTKHIPKINILEMSCTVGSRYNCRIVQLPTRFSLFAEL